MSRSQDSVAPNSSAWLDEGWDAGGTGDTDAPAVLGERRRAAVKCSYATRNWWCTRDARPIEGKNVRMSRRTSPSSCRDRRRPRIYDYRAYRDGKETNTRTLWALGRERGGERERERERERMRERKDDRSERETNSRLRERKRERGVLGASLTKHRFHAARVGRFSGLTAEAKIGKIHKPNVATLRSLAHPLHCPRTAPRTVQARLRSLRFAESRVRVTSAALGSRPNDLVRCAIAGATSFRST